mmetsp:Transcript_2220/g.9609  ORF Transcript_2220/g.9609 Transcript_2220/m.9609 type:complete len:307 (+) Transcript_2220:2179-3099(+)
MKRKEKKERFPLLEYGKRPSGGGSPCYAISKGIVRSTASSSLRSCSVLESFHDQLTHGVLVIRQICIQPILQLRAHLFDCNSAWVTVGDDVSHPSSNLLNAGPGNRQGRLGHLCHLALLALVAARACRRRAFPSRRLRRLRRRLRGGLLRAARLLLLSARAFDHAQLAFVPVARGGILEPCDQSIHEHLLGRIAPKGLRATLDVCNVHDHLEVRHAQLGRLRLQRLSPFLFLSFLENHAAELSQVRLELALLAHSEAQHVQHLEMRIAEGHLAHVCHHVGHLAERRAPPLGDAALLGFGLLVRGEP